ncbi:MAG: hypothetical protein Q4B94_05510 [Pseudomonadota bacterium]|nr:hypothetical protein [Pseudomonadota bacterium]
MKDYFRESIEDVVNDLKRAGVDTRGYISDALDDKVIFASKYSIGTFPLLFILFFCVIGAWFAYFVDWDYSGASPIARLAGVVLPFLAPITFILLFSLFKGWWRACKYKSVFIITSGAVIFTGGKEVFFLPLSKLVGVYESGDNVDVVFLGGCGFEFYPSYVRNSRLLMEILKGAAASNNLALGR